MKTELLHKYFRGETTEKEENQIVEWVESSVENKEHFLKERMLFDVTLFSDGSNIQRKPKGHLYLYPLIAIAAMLAIVFVWICHICINLNNNCHKPSVFQQVNVHRWIFLTVL